MQNPKVLIGIQARSGSTRLPRKAFEMIGHSRMLDHVIDACKSASKYLDSIKVLNIKSEVVVVSPVGDPIVNAFSARCRIIEGSEPDVLSRYAGAVNVFDPDYIIRITGDCPLIPSYVISKMATLAVKNKYDYVSNVDDFRTSLDGSDCEVLSRKMFNYVHDVASIPADREHVTTIIRRCPPDWARIGAVVGHFDHSDIKLSVDTPDDLKKVRDAYDSVTRRVAEAERRYGRQAIHRL